jgi:hypothetical protein
VKLAQINLILGQYIPGLGNVKKLENVEVEEPPALAHRAGLVVVTPSARVLIPWERIENVVTEWIGIKAPQIVTKSRDELAAIYPAEQADGPVRMTRIWPDTESQAGQAANLQPPPPPKRGGRR